MKRILVLFSLLGIFLFCSFPIYGKTTMDTNDSISLWVGDSRVVLIYQDKNMKTKSNISYRDKTKVEGKFLMLKYGDCYAGRGTGYNFVKDSIPYLSRKIGKKSNQNIIFSSGINDIYNSSLHSFSSLSSKKIASMYWKLYEKNFIKKYKENNFFITSISPIYKPLSYHGNTVTNKKIKIFNKKMKQLIEKSSYENVFFINTYQWFKKNHYIKKKSSYRYNIKYRKMKIRHMRESSSFQLHYDRKINKKLFQFVNSFIENQL